MVDLAELEPDLAKGLQHLLEYDGDVQDFAAEMCFQLTYEGMFGEVRVVDLKPDGASLTVTNENRQEYVDLYVQHILETSVAPQFEAFAKGFKKVDF